MNGRKRERSQDEEPEGRALDAQRRERRDANGSKIDGVKGRQRLGAGLLSIVIIAVIVSRLWPSDSPPNPNPTPTQNPDSTQSPAPTSIATPTPLSNLVVVNGYGGQLKYNILNDPDVQAILKDRYGLLVNVQVAGSIALACGRSFGPDDDFVWLGDSVALATYRQRGSQFPERGCVSVASDNIYNSPMVLLSWADVVDKLVAAGIAHVTPDGVYTIDFDRLAGLMKAGETWASLGLPNLRGKVLVRTTDPNKSNSGFIFAGLLANTYNGGDIVNATTVDPLLSDIQAYFLQLGYMEENSGDLFEQFLIQGIGGRPIVALYESQIPEYLAANPSAVTQIGTEVRILYLQPTVWAQHPFVARTNKGALLLEALKDPDIQRLAWERHGQRPGVPSVSTNQQVIPIAGIMPDVRSLGAVDMPATDVMKKILDAIAAKPVSMTPPPATSPPSAMQVATPPG